MKMRKLLLASAFLASFAGAPAFAGANAKYDAYIAEEGRATAALEAKKSKLSKGEYGKLERELAAMRRDLYANMASMPRGEFYVKADGAIARARKIRETVEAK